MPCMQYFCLASPNYVCFPCDTTILLTCTEFLRQLQGLDRRPRSVCTRSLLFLQCRALHWSWLNFITTSTAKFSSRSRPFGIAILSPKCL